MNIFILKFVDGSNSTFTNFTGMDLGSLEPRTTYQPFCERARSTLVVVEVREKWTRKLRRENGAKPVKPVEQTTANNSHFDD